MSEEIETPVAPVEEKSGGIGAAGVIGGVAVAGGAGYLADKQFTKRFAKGMANGSTKKSYLEALEKETDTTKKEALTKAFEEKEKVVADALKGEKAQKAFDAAAREKVSDLVGLRLLDNEATHPMVSEVVFEKGAKGHDALVKLNLSEEQLGKMTKDSYKEMMDELGYKAAEVKFDEAGKATEVGFKIKNIQELPHGVELKEGKAILKGEELKKLNSVAEGAAKDAKSWTGTVIEGLKKDLQSVEAKAFSAEAKLGTGFKRGGNWGKAAIIGSVIVGGYVGAKVFHAIFGGKHTNKVEERAAAPAQQQVGA